MPGPPPTADGRFWLRCCFRAAWPFRGAALIPTRAPPLDADCWLGRRDAAESKPEVEAAVDEAAEAWDDGGGGDDSGLPRLKGGRLIFRGTVGGETYRGR